MRRPSSMVLAVCFSLLAVLLVSCSPSSFSGKSEATQAGGGGSTATPDSLVGEYDQLADSILGARKAEVAIVRKILDATFASASAAHQRAQAALKSNDKAAAKSSIESLVTLVAQMGTEGDASVARVRKRLVEGGHHFNPILAGGLGAGTHAPGGAHHGPDGAHHVDGQKPAHHADGQQPAHHAEGQKPAHHAEGQKPGAVAAGTPTTPATPGTTTTPPGGQAPAHHAEGQKPAHHAEGQPPAHHAAGEQPGHHADKDGHHAGAAPGGIGYDPGFVVISRATRKTLIDASRAIAQLAAAPDAAALAAEWAKVETVWSDVKKSID